MARSALFLLSFFTFMNFIFTSLRKREGNTVEWWAGSTRVELTVLRRNGQAHMSKKRNTGNTPQTAS